jgi:hypothetical protein
MKNVCKIFMLLVLGGILSLVLVIPGMSYSSQITSLGGEEPYPPPTRVILTSSQENPTFTKLFLPIILKSFPPLPTTSWYLQTVNTDMLYNLGCTLGERDRDMGG